MNSITPTPFSTPYSSAGPSPRSASDVSMTCDGTPVNLPVISEVEEEFTLGQPPKRLPKITIEVSSDLKTRCEEMRKLYEEASSALLQERMSAIHNRTFEEMRKSPLGDTDVKSNSQNSLSRREVSN